MSDLEVLFREVFVSKLLRLHPSPVISEMHDLRLSKPSPVPSRFDFLDTSWLVTQPGRSQKSQAPLVAEFRVAS